MPRFNHALRQRFAQALAALLLLAALAPAVGRAVMVVQGNLAPWSVLCSSPVAAAGQAGSGKAAGQGLGEMADHCQFCVPRADLQAPPPALPQAVVATGLSHAVPQLFLAAPQPLFAWASAQARAPPVLA